MDSPKNLSVDYLNLLPDEILVEILLKTDDLKTLSRLCRTSKRINLICQDGFFWHRKYHKDFGGTILVEGETWRELYKQRTLGSINSPISAGGEHYAIIDSNGILYMAGENNEGQLGKGLKSTHHSVITPFPFKGGLIIRPTDSEIPNIISVACGEEFTGAVTEDGKAYWWGKPMASYGSSGTPRFVRALKSRKAVKISAGPFGYAVILDDGSVYINKRLGGWYTHTRIINGIFPLNVLDILITMGRIYIISKDYKLYMFGQKITESTAMYSGYEIGLEGEGKDLKINPIHIPLPEPVKKVSEGNLGILVLLRSGTVHNLDNRGQISPKLNLPPISQIVSSGSKMAAITRDGKLYMWGASEMGEIIDNDIGMKLPNVTVTYPWGVGMSADYLDDPRSRPYKIINIPSPIQIDIGLPVKYVAMGNDFTIAVTSDGVVNYWGTPIWAPE